MTGAPALANLKFNERDLDFDDGDSVPFWLGSTGETAMAQYVILDAMIPREDFGREVPGEFSVEQIRDFPFGK